MELKVKIKKRLGNFFLDAEFETDRPLALLGASGSGKSVTLKCIAGIEKPDEGYIILNGRTLFDSEKKIDLSPQKRNVGYLFQNYALFPNMTVRKNIEAGAGRQRKKADSLIKDFYLEGVKDKYPWEISGGQQQRTALARIIASEPEILLLDEPLSAIDGYMRWQLELTLSDIIRNFGGMYLMVTHDMGEAYRNCGRICTIDNGKTQGTSEREDFINSPSSVGAARISGCKNIFAFERTENDGEIFVPELNINLSISGNLDGRSHIAFRDSAVDFDCRENRMECMIERVIDDAFSTIIMLRPLNEKDALLRAEIKKDRAACFCAGKKVTVGVRAEDIMPLE